MKRFINRKIASGRKESLNGPALNETSYDYYYNDDGDDDTIKYRVVQTDPLNHTTTYKYDANDRLKYVIDALNFTTAYDYYDNGWLLFVTDARNNTTNYYYDNVGNVLTETLPDNTSTRWTYNAVNITASQTDALNRTTNYAYDSMGRLTGKTYLFTPSTPPVTYSYDQDGHRIGMVDGIGTSAYQYDLNGNLVQVRDCLGREVTYSYDGANRRVGMGTSFGPVTYKYDNTGSVEAITDFKGNRITFDYDADGKTTNINYPQGGTAEYTYNDLDQMTGFDYTNALERYNRASFQYDANGNCVHISQQKYDEYDDLSENTNTFTYDSLGRLVQSTFSSPDATAYDITYTYDAAGNRVHYLYDTYEYSNDKDISYTYNSTNCLTHEAESANKYVNEYEYDDNGNQKNVINTYRKSGYMYPGYTVTRLFDRENRLTRVDERIKPSNDTKCSKFYYNGDGQLMKVVNTFRGDEDVWDSVFYLYDGDQVIADLDGANALIACYTRTGGGRLLSMYNSENNVDGVIHGDFERDIYYTFCDQLGTVMGLYGKETEKTKMEMYESYGFNNGNSDIMRFSFTGAPYFSEVGLYQMGARYYNPEIGRFITRDSYRGDIYRPWTRNLYTYCNNNPVNYVDPTGHSAEEYDPEEDDPSLKYMARKMALDTEVDDPSLKWAVAQNSGETNSAPGDAEQNSGETNSAPREIAIENEMVNKLVWSAFDNLPADYISGQANGGLILGGTLQISITKDGYIFVGKGVNVGKSAPASFSATAGIIEVDGAAPNQFCNGLSYNICAGDGYGAGVTISPGNGISVETGFYTPQIGISRVKTVPRIKFMR